MLIFYNYLINMNKLYSNMIIFVDFYDGRKQNIMYIQSKINAKGLQIRCKDNKI